MTTSYTIEDLTQLFNFAFAAGDPECARVALQAAQTTNQQIDELLRPRAVINNPSPEVFAAFGRYGAEKVLLKVLLKMLAHADWEMRGEVVKALRWVGGPEALDAIKGAQQDEDDWVRMWANRAVKDLEGHPGQLTGPIEHVVEPLGVLDDRGLTIAAVILGNVDQSDFQIVATLIESPSLGESAKTILRQGGRNAGNSLFEVLAERQAPLTIELVQLLGQIGDDRGIEYLLKTAQQAGKELRDACISTLPKFDSLDNPKVIETLIKVLGDDYENWEVKKVIKVIGDPVVPHLLQAYASNPQIRRHQGKLVAEVAGAKAVPVLLEALKDPYRAVREDSASGLKILREPAVNGLIKLLEDGHPSEIQRLAIRVLGKIGEPKALEFISAMIGHPETRDIAIETLGRFPTDHSFKLLDEILRQGNRATERCAWKAIEKFEKAHPRPAQLIPLLIESLNYPSPYVRVNAFEHLQRIGAKKEVPAERITQSMIDVLSNHDPELAERAIRALVSISETSRAFIQTELTSARGVLRMRILQTLERIDDMIRDEQRNRENTRDTETLIEQGHADFSLVTPMIELSPKVPYPITDNVNMSVTAPMMSTPGESFILGVWVHRFGNTEVLRRATEQQREREPHIETKGPVPLERGAILNVQLSIPHFGLDSLNDIIYWPGEDWRKRLRREILSRDIFFLFWSLAASKSTSVEKEWRAALDGKGLDFISPVPLVSPEKVPPPKELASLHFNEWTLAFEKT